MTSLMTTLSPASIISILIKIMQILIPISGHSKFFPEEEYFFPKPLIEISGIPMIELVVNRLRSQFPSSTFIFVIDPSDARSFSLDRTLQILTNNQSIIIEKPGPTSGALCTCLLSVNSLNLSEPLLIVNSDQLIDFDINLAVNTFVDRGASSGVITFKSVHPRWSYVSSDDQGNVLQACEKRVISRHAIAGCYYFNRASLFIEAAKKVLIKDACVNGQFFISSSLNELILEDCKVCNSLLILVVIILSILLLKSTNLKRRVFSVIPFVNRSLVVMTT